MHVRSGGDAGGTGAEGGEKKDDVVDAEFTEVDDKKKRSLRVDGQHGVIP